LYNIAIRRLDDRKELWHMSDNLIITIGRECGSGGRHIGQALAEKLGVKCYDKELLNLAAKESGLCKSCLRPTTRSRRAVSYIPW